MSCGLTGMSTIRSRPIPKGMSFAKMIFFGTRCFAGEWRDLGYQSLLSRIAMARLQMDSGMDPHSEGQGAPPKPSQSIINARPLDGSWVHVACRNCCHHVKVALPV